MPTKHYVVTCNMSGDPDTEYFSVEASSENAALRAVARYLYDKYEIAEDSDFSEEGSQSFEDYLQQCTHTDSGKILDAYTAVYLKQD